MTCNNFYISGEHGKWFWLTVGGALVAAVSVTCAAVACAVVLGVKQ